MFRYLEKNKQKYKKSASQSKSQSFNDSESQISKQFSSDFSENETIPNSKYEYSDNEQSEYPIQDQDFKIDSGPKKRKKNKKGKNKKRSR
jgi:hypothetical protein